jgi:hypothetical protein
MSGARDHLQTVPYQKNHRQRTAQGDGETQAQDRNRKTHVKKTPDKVRTKRSRKANSAAAANSNPARTFNLIADYLEVDELEGDLVAGGELDAAEDLPEAAAAHELALAVAVRGRHRARRCAARRQRLRARPTQMRWGT